MAQQAERQMGKLIWDFLNGESDQRVRDEVSRAVIGGSPPGRLSCWNGPTPGVDLLFADEHDVLQACVELKRRYGPSQYSSVRHLKGAALFRSGDGKVDPVSAEIVKAAAGQRTDRHLADGDACDNEQHTQRRRDGTGAHTWWCGLPQIDLYRGFALLPADSTAAVQQQDPRRVAWVLISDDERPVASRYPNAKSAQCWTARTWTQVLAELDAATTPRIGVLRDALDSLR